MEVDPAIVEVQPETRPALKITVPEDSPYDLEQVAANYEGERVTRCCGSSLKGFGRGAAC